LNNVLFSVAIISVIIVLWQGNLEITLSPGSLFSWVRIMAFNATFKTISVISWQSVLLVEETGVP
jgi:hypothetical protein